MSLGVRILQWNPFFKGKLANRLIVGLSSLLVFSLSCHSSGGGSKEEIQKEIETKFNKVPMMTVEELQEELKDSVPVMLIDVRATREYKISHLKNAIHIEEVKEIMHRFPDKKSRLVLYCSVGYRSSKVAQKLIEEGYTKVANLKGSLFEWINKGLPVYKGEERTNFAHPFNKKWGKLLNSEYHKYE